MLVSWLQDRQVASVNLGQLVQEQMTIIAIPTNQNEQNISRCFVSPEISWPVICPSPTSWDGLQPPFRTALDDGWVQQTYRQAQIHPWNGAFIHLLRTFSTSNCLSWTNTAFSFQPEALFFLALLSNPSTFNFICLCFWDCCDLRHLQPHTRFQMLAFAASEIQFGSDKKMHNFTHLHHGYTD